MPEVREAFVRRGGSLARLRNTVLARLVVVALLPLGVLAIYLQHQFTTAQEQSARALLQTVARGHQETVDGTIERKVALLKGLAPSGLIQLPPTQQELSQLLEVLQGLDPMILDIGVFDASGIHVRYAGPVQGLEGRSYADDPWFCSLSADDSRDVFVSDVYRGHRDEPHFVVAVRSTVAQRPWYLRLTINPERFTSLVNNVGVLRGADAFIVNPELRYQVVPAGVGKPLESATGMESKLGEQQVEDVTIDGTEYLVAAAGMRATGWTLVVRQTARAAYEPVEKTRRGALLIVALGIALILLASLAATLTLVRRYERAEAQRAELLDQLVQAGKLGTLGEMAAGVAHEINNPLAVIASEVGVMEDDLDPAFGGELEPDQVREQLKSIKEEVYRCRDITHKLLGFARFHETELERRDVGDIVRHSVGLLGKQLELENIDLDLELDERLPPILTDADKLEQVLLNLLRNAADAIGKNGRIEVRSSRDGNAAVVAVEDDGPGIDPEHLGRVFEPFFTTKQVGKGTGLGLSISHGIVSSLGGEISVASTPGVGTTFQVRLPLDGPPTA
jgi:two-component system NtrC family sensor kinase